jgi:hypothetical protein
MTQYKYTGFYTTVYTDTLDSDGNVVVAEPGQTYNIDTAPDTLWVSVNGSQKAPKASVADATPEPESTPTQSESEPQ